MTYQKNSTDSTPVFEYCEADFTFELESRTHDVDAPFDSILISKWVSAKHQGLFRFSLNTKLPTRCLPGKYGFRLQLNPDRHTTRRAPPALSSTRQPPDPARFHFGRVPAGEHLFRVRRTPAAEPGRAEDADADCLLINVSPIGPGHSLLVPRLGRLRGQQLDRHGLQLLIDLLLVSRSTALRGLFNSLGALASVNHYHLHLYYFEYALYVETAPVLRLAEDLYQLTEYPAPAFVFEVTQHNYSTVASRVVALSELILDEGFAFNLVACRGRRCSAGPPAERGLHDAVRLFIWPRRPELRMVPRDDYQVASCELAGHVAVTSAEALQSLTELSVAEDLRAVVEPAFNQLRDVVLARFGNGINGTSS